MRPPTAIPAPQARRTYLDTALRDTEHAFATARSPRPHDHFRRNVALTLRMDLFSSA